MMKQLILFALFNDKHTVSCSQEESFLFSTSISSNVLDRTYKNEKISTVHVVNTPESVQIYIPVMNIEKAYIKKS